MKCQGVLPGFWVEFVVWVKYKLPLYGPEIQTFHEGVLTGQALVQSWGVPAPPAVAHI